MKCSISFQKLTLCMRLCVLSSPSSILSTFSLAVTSDSWMRLFCKTTFQEVEQFSSLRPKLFLYFFQRIFPNVQNRSFPRSLREVHESEPTFDLVDCTLFRLLFPPLLLIWLRSLSLIVFFTLPSSSSSSIAIVD